MSKKLILFLMVLLFGSANLLRADEVTFTIDFETNDFSQYNFVNASTYPWVITSDDSNTGTYCMKSGNSGVSSSNSTIEATFEFPTDGSVSFAALCMGEGTSTAWDKCIFKIDGEEQFAYGANVSGWNDYSYEVEAGSHTFTWSYTKDSSVNPTGDYMMVDDIVFTYEGTNPNPPVPPTPTGDLVVTPNPFDLGVRPTNAWVEPYSVKITNGGATTTIEGTMSNTSGLTPFALSTEVSGELATDESITFDIDINTELEDGDYNEEFTMFYVGEKSIVTIPVTSTFYTATEPDVVEFPGTVILNYEDGVATYTDTPQDIQANYYIRSTTIKEKDAIYALNLTKDSRVTISTEDGFIGIYDRELDFHPSSAVEPLYSTTDGELVEDIVFKGNYYVIVASDNFSTITITVEQYPAPTPLVPLAPADGATGLSGAINLEWEGGENATEYRVLFGTSPTNMPVVMDWTEIDDNYGTYSVAGLVQNNTQYFWQIQARNSEGMVSSPRRGFTSALTAPNDVTVTPGEIFVDGSATLRWKHSAGGGGYVGEITVAEGTATSTYIPVFGLWMDDYTRSEMIYPEAMIEEMMGGSITSMTFYISSPATGPWSGDVFNVYLKEVPTTTFTQYYMPTDATIVYTGALDGQGTTMTVNFTTPYVYTGGNLLVGFEETVCGTYKSCTFSGIEATGASASGYNSQSVQNASFNQRNFLPKTTFVCGGKKDVEQNRSFLGFNIYDGDEKLNGELVTEKQYLLENLEYNMQGHNIAVSAVYDEGESSPSTPAVLMVSGYGKLTGNVKELISNGAIAGATVRVFGKDEFNNDVNYEAVTDNTGKYTMDVKTGTYNRGMVTKDGMQTVEMTDAVTVAYGATEVVDFVMHEVYNPVMSVYAEEVDPTMTRILWSMRTLIGDRGVSYYTLYRKALLKEAALVPADSVVLADNYTDTFNIDLTWGTMLPGLYQYGVSAVYPIPTKGGNREEVIIGEGGATAGYVPTYNLYNYSLTNQIYTVDEIGGPGVISSLAFMPGTVNTTSRTLEIYMINVDKTAFASTSDWTPVTEDNLVYSGEVNWTANAWSGVTLDNPFFYDGTNLCIVVRDLTGTWTSSNQYKVDDTEGNQALYHYRDGSAYDPSNPGVAGTLYAKKNMIKMDITFGGGGGGTSDDPVTPITWSNVLAKDMETTVTVNVTVPFGSVEGTKVLFINQFEEGVDFEAELEADGTVTFEDFRKGEYLFTVSLEGYTTPYDETPVSIWEEKTYNIDLEEIFAPVEEVLVSSTGFARWTPVVPVDRIPEKYFVKLDGTFVTETTDNYYQFEGLEEGTSHVAGIAVIYSMGMSEYVNRTFTYTGCAAVTPQVTDLVVDSTNCVDMNVVIAWNGATPTPPTPTPPTPPLPPTGDVTVKLTVGDVWGDGSGYQMLLDDTHSLYGTTIPETGALSMNCTGNDGIYSQFSHKIPVNADGNCTTGNIVLNNSVEITIPAGIYDWCIVNPTPGDRLWIASAQGNVGGRQDDYTFEGGHIYEFTVTLQGSNDATNVTITGGKVESKPSMGYDSDVRTAEFTAQAPIYSEEYNRMNGLAPRTEQGTINPMPVIEGLRGNTAYACNAYGGTNPTGWISYDIDAPSSATSLNSNLVVYGGSIAADGYVYATYNDNTWKKIDPTTGAIVGSGSLGMFFVDCTYDYTEDIMYGSYSGTLYAWDLTTHTTTTIGSMHGSMQMIACDMNGQLYGIEYSTGDFYAINKTNGACTLIGNTGQSPAYVQSGGFDHNTGKLYWAGYTSQGIFAEVNVATGAITMLATNVGEQLSWSVPYTYNPGPLPGGYTPKKYNVMVDGEIVGATSDCYYTYECPDFENHVYSVIWVDADYNISCEQSVEYEIHHVGMPESEIVNAIYPNPTSGDLHIAADAMTRISIVNTMGQVVYEQNVKANQIVVDMAKFEAGVYMVNIFTENGSSVKRVTVVK